MKEIVNFTKPYATKNCYVQIELDHETNVYVLSGIGSMGELIERSSTNYHEVAHIFFYELCWMLNEKKMAETTIQRSMPKSAARIKGHSK